MKVRPVLIALVAFIGMIDTFYLSMKRNAGPIPCHITHGCSDVLTSKYSEVAGIPLSWLGLAFYLTVLSLAVFHIFGESEQRSALPLKLIFYLSGVGLIVSALLVGIQAFVLKAYCEYCLLSAGLVLTIFLLTPNPSPNDPNPVPHRLPE
jgi:uncharacterized membrane protein